VNAWNGAALNVPGGSAKSLGLVRTDSESTATVTRQHDGKSKADWNDGSDTLDRKSKPEPEDDEDGDGPATVLKGQKKIVLPAEKAPPSSSDDDDLNETARATTDSDSVDTPVGVKKVTPPATSKPESGQTRVAPIVVPPTATAGATPVRPSMVTPPAWTPPSVPPPATTPASIAAAITAKALALPPHKLALIASMTLMVAALTFVFVRSHQPAAPVTAATTTTEQALFPPPVEVPPAAATTGLPPPTLVLPPPAPTYASQPPSQAQPHTTTAKAPPVHRSIPRATSRTSIPTHREQ
jgi:hypothetical protein